MDCTPFAWSSLTSFNAKSTERRTTPGMLSMQARWFFPSIKKIGATRSQGMRCVSWIIFRIAGDCLLRLKRMGISIMPAIMDEKRFLSNRPLSELALLEKIGDFLSRFLETACSFGSNERVDLKSRRERAIKICLEKNDFSKQMKFRKRSNVTSIRLCCTNPFDTDTAPDTDTVPCSVRYRYRARYRYRFVQQSP